MKGLYFCFSKTSPSILSIYMQAYVRAHLVPMVAPKICCLIWPLNSKKFFFNANSAIWTNSAVGVFFCSLLSKTSLNIYHSIFCAPITKLWKTFVKTLTLSKIQAYRWCLCWIWLYWTNIYQWYFYFHTHWNIHPEVLHTSTLNSMTQLDDDLLFHEIIYF